MTLTIDPPARRARSHFTSNGESMTMIDTMQGARRANFPVPPCLSWTPLCPPEVTHYGGGGHEKCVIAPHQIGASQSPPDPSDPRWRLMRTTGSPLLVGGRADQLSREVISPLTNALLVPAPCSLPAFRPNWG